MEKSHLDKNLSKLQDQLKLWRAKLDQTMANVNVAGQQAKIDSQKQLDELRSKLVVAESKLEEAKAAGSEKWDNLKSGLDHTWKELEQTFKKLVH
jgi:chromosome segregation ATPase